MCTIAPDDDSNWFIMEAERLISSGVAEIAAFEQPNLEGTTRETLFQHLVSSLRHNFAGGSVRAGCFPLAM